MDQDGLLLGVDGGGTRCRARLCTPAGSVLGEAGAGPANIHVAFEQSFAAVLDATQQCLSGAGLTARDHGRIVACLALAGASEPAALARAQRYQHPFRKAVITTDAHAACLGAHGGRDGGVIVSGTGSIGWAQTRGRQVRVSGWGLPISDEGSGAWVGCEALRRVLWAHDGRIPWSGMLRALFDRFQSDPHAIVPWTAKAWPRDFGSLAPLIVEHARKDDPVAVELMRLAAAHIDAMAARFVALGVERIALAGSFAPHLQSWLGPQTQSRLVAPAGDALDGALQLARSAADAIAA